MTIAWPALQPYLGAKNQVFELDRVDYLAPEARGRIGGVSAGWPLWKSTVTFGILTSSQSDAWRAFYLGQRGAQRIWYGFEIARRLPRNYLQGLPNGWNGNCASWAQAIDGNGYAVVSLSGLPPGLVLAPGDYIGLRWGSFQRLLVRCLENATANSSGLLQVSVEPPIHFAVPGTAVAYLNNPTCLMKFIPQESNLGAVGRRGAIEAGTLVAIQDIIP